MSVSCVELVPLRLHFESKLRRTGFLKSGRGFKSLADRSMGTLLPVFGRAFDGNAALCLAECSTGTLPWILLRVRLGRCLESSGALDRDAVSCRAKHSTVTLPGVFRSVRRGCCVVSGRTFDRDTALCLPERRRGH